MIDAPAAAAASDAAASRHEQLMHTAREANPKILGISDRDLDFIDHVFGSDDTKQVTPHATRTNHDASTRIVQTVRAAANPRLHATTEQPLSEFFPLSSREQLTTQELLRAALNVPNKQRKWSDWRHFTKATNKMVDAAVQRGNMKLYKAWRSYQNFITTLFLDFGWAAAVAR